MNETAVPRRSRIAVYAFLGAILVSGPVHLHYWPLTGFRLYDDIRHRTHQTWELEAATRAGVEREVTLYDLPIAYRNTDRQLGRAVPVELPHADAVCRAWAGAFAARDPEFATLRIYRTRIDARSGEKVTRVLAHSCSADAP